MLDLDSIEVAFVKSLLRPDVGHQRRQSRGLLLRHLVVGDDFPRLARYGLL